MTINVFAQDKLTREETLELIVKSADKCFGAPYQITLKDGYTTTVNISGKKQRAKKFFISKSINALKDVESIKAKIDTKNEYADVVKQTMIQEGTSGIEAYFKIKEEIKTMEVDLYFAQENFNRLISSCNKTEIVDTSEDEEDTNKINNKTKEEAYNDDEQIYSLSVTK